ncbi:MAG TPA: ribonuclease P protein component [Paludibacteraceae bacterium]|nr:ribonuclease P protein component [Paludibacteraceae bacterium]
MILLGLFCKMEALHRHTFPKSQHLTGRTAIVELFAEGKSFVQFPIRVIVRRVPKEKEPIRVLLSVPKSHFKRAVDRNRYKRLLRETYRLNNGSLLVAVADKDYSLHVAFVVMAQEMPSYADLSLLMQKVIENIGERLP